MIPDHPAVKWLGLGLAAVTVGALIYGALLFFQEEQRRLDTISSELQGIHEKVENNEDLQVQWRAAEDQSSEDGFRAEVMRELGSIKERQDALSLQLVTLENALGHSIDHLENDIDDVGDAVARVEGMILAGREE